MKNLVVSLLCLFMLTACDTAYVAVEERPIVGVVYYGSTPYYYSRPYYYHRHYRPYRHYYHNDWRFNRPMHRPHGGHFSR